MGFATTWTRHAACRSPRPACRGSRRPPGSRARHRRRTAGCAKHRPRGTTSASGPCERPRREAVRPGRRRTRGRGNDRPRPERRSRVEGPGGRGERAARLRARRHLDLLGAPKDHRQLVDGREAFGHDAGERLRDRVVTEREGPELHLAALHLRRHAAERGADEVRGRHRRLQQHLAVGAGLELERERRRLAVVRDRSGPGARELGGKRARRRLGRGRGLEEEREEKGDAEDREHGASSPRPRPRPPRRSARRCGGPRRSAASRHASRARAPAAAPARDTPAGWPPRRAAVRP